MLKKKINRLKTYNIENGRYRSELFFPTWNVYKMEGLKSVLVHELNLSSDFQNIAVSTYLISNSN